MFDDEWSNSNVSGSASYPIKSRQYQRHASSAKVLMIMWWSRLMPRMMMKEALRLQKVQQKLESFDITTYHFVSNDVDMKRFSCGQHFLLKIIIKISSTTKLRHIARKLIKINKAVLFRGGFHEYITSFLESFRGYDLEKVVEAPSSVYIEWMIYT